MKIYLDCTERFLFTEKDVVSPGTTSLLHSTRELKQLKELLEVIDGHYKEKLTRDFALKKMGMSKSRFSAFFRHQTGMTYITYINRIRTKKALHLLRETDMKVETIGFDCGFSSLPIFYKCFKEHYGVTPGELRVNG